MKRKRLSPFRRRARESENLDGGQDSFLDVVSNLVGVLIILIMVAGVRVRNASSEQTPFDSSSNSTIEAQKSGLSEEELTRRVEYAETFRAAKELSNRVIAEREATDASNERALMVQSLANGAEAEYQETLQAFAQLDALFKSESLKKSDAEKRIFDLKSALIEKEKARDELKLTNEALANSRPKATALQNIPTPISQRVADGREGFFRLKNGRLSHVPLNAFQERVVLNFKNYRGDMTPRRIENKIGPIDGYNFQYYVDLNSTRSAEGVTYHFEFQYGECQPTSDLLGEPVDDAIVNEDSLFRNRLFKYSRDDTTITIFVYPDSYEYLNDIKKFLFSKGYMMAMRPLSENEPIAVSPYGTASASY